MEQKLWRLQITINRVGKILEFPRLKNCSSFPRLKKWSQFLQSFPGTSQNDERYKINSWKCDIYCLEYFIAQNVDTRECFRRALPLWHWQSPHPMLKQGRRYVTDNKALPIGERPFMSHWANLRSSSGLYNSSNLSKGWLKSGRASFWYTELSYHASVFWHFGFILY